ncbi:MAG TPA: MiaB/RimO family radical SAM methylthiotransferase [Phycisphaerae bacterium]|nr:MiaB/RimO family radical SAM methylthiotransferase [Phycisphaerae bacterium]
MRRFSLTTLGCKVNQYDSRALAALLEGEGLRPAQGDEPADLAVVNTCCITAVAMRKSRNAIRRALRRSPAATIVVAGCYGDYDAARLRQLLDEMGVGPGRAVIAGHHGNLAGAVRKALAPPAPPTDDAPREGEPADGDSLRQRRLRALGDGAPGAANLPPAEKFPGRKRAFVKVQDGCDAFCTYCVVPYTRSRVWSRPVDEILAECRALLAAGHREIVLSGVFLGAYGRATAIRRRWDPGPAPLVDLLRRVARLEGLWRVRLSSLEPGDVTDELLDAARGEPAFAPHFHLPLQSGSARVLRRMNRQYTPAEFTHAVARIRRAFDRAALTADVIVGFCGESDDDFSQTLRVAREAGFAKIHAFPFSAIAGTAAWQIRAEAPPPAVVRARLGELAALERELADAYRRQFVGETLEALVETASGATARGLTDRHVPVTFAAPSGAGRLGGRVVRVRAEAVTPDGLSAALVEA